LLGIASWGVEIKAAKRHIKLEQALQARLAERTETAHQHRCIRSKTGNGPGWRRLRVQHFNMKISFNMKIG
jgi:hypothetical protein